MRRLPLYEANPQLAYEFTDRATVVTSEELRKMYGVDTNGLCDFLERQRITEPVVQKVIAED